MQSAASPHTASDTRPRWRPEFQLWPCIHPPVSRVLLIALLGRTRRCPCLAPAAPAAPEPALAATRVSSLCHCPCSSQVLLPRMPRGVAHPEPLSPSQRSRPAPPCASRGTCCAKCLSFDWIASCSSSSTGEKRPTFSRRRNAPGILTGPKSAPRRRPLARYPPRPSMS